jgi:hypothetical protein
MWLLSSKASVVEECLNRSRVVQAQKTKPTTAAESAKSVAAFLRRQELISVGRVETQLELFWPDSASFEFNSSLVTCININYFL